MKKRRIFNGILLIICGAICYWLFLSHMLGYNDWYLLAHPEVETYVGVNVVSKFANFAFFTYITLLLFGTWCILFGFSLIFKENKFEKFFRKSSVISFIFTNYFITSIVYTIFVFTVTNGTFGLYSKTAPLALHNFGTNIIVHYVLFAVACVIFSKVKSEKSNLKAWKIFVCDFLFLYYIVVKVTGELVYRVRWFPYVIFDAKSFAQMINVSYGVSVFLLVLIVALIVCEYLFFYTIFAKAKDKQREKELRKNVVFNKWYLKFINTFFNLINEKNTKNKSTRFECFFILF